MLAAAVFAAAGTGAILAPVRALVGLRAPARAEREGIDVAEHAEAAYARDQTQAPAVPGLLATEPDTWV